jgi:hypothetical protein
VQAGKDPTLFPRFVDENLHFDKFGDKVWDKVGFSHCDVRSRRGVGKRLKQGSQLQRQISGIEKQLSNVEM